LYSHDSQNVATDPVFGVKKSLIKQFAWSEDAALARQYNIEMIEKVDKVGKKTSGFWTLEHAFILVQK
jgi:hypothetical protein